jgi:hypothetical protein
MSNQSGFSMNKITLYAFEVTITAGALLTMGWMSYTLFALAVILQVFGIAMMLYLNSVLRNPKIIFREDKLNPNGVDINMNIIEFLVDLCREFGELTGKPKVAVSIQEWSIIVVVLLLSTYQPVMAAILLVLRILSYELLRTFLARGYLALPVILKTAKDILDNRMAFPEKGND